MKLKIRSIRGRSRSADSDRSDGGGCKGERIEGSLMIDCVRCPNGQDLGNEACLRSVIAAMADKGATQEILLRGDCDVRLNGLGVEMLREVADLVRVARELSRRSIVTERCDQCPTSAERVFTLCAERLMRLSPLATEPNFRPSDPTCRRCRERIDAEMARIRNRYHRIEERLSMEVFHVVVRDANDQTGHCLEA